MANITASGGAGANGRKFLWNLVFDDAANTVTITATHTTFAGDPTSDPQEAAITVTTNNNQQISVDCLTGLMSTGGQFSQSSPGEILNQGPKTRTNVRLRISADRAAALEFSTQYTP